MQMLVSNNEYNILLAIWNAGRALTAREILDSMEDKSFKDRTIHSILNAMMEKGLIYVDGQKLTSRIYSRCFNASLRFEEYHADCIMDNAVYRREKSRVLPGLLSALVDDEDVSSETIDRLEALLEEKKRQLGHGSDHL